MKERGPLNPNPNRRQRTLLRHYPTLLTKVRCQISTPRYSRGSGSYATTKLSGIVSANKPIGDRRDYKQTRRGLYCMRRWEDGTFKPYDKQKQAAGRKGGKATGDTKKRTGKANGRYAEGKDRQACCGAIKGRSHKAHCENHRSNKEARALRREGKVVSPTKKKVADADFIEVAPVAFMLTGCELVCVICNEPKNKAESRKVHRDDCTQPSMRVICEKCA